MPFSGMGIMNSWVPFLDIMKNVVTCDGKYRIMGIRMNKCNISWKMLESMDWFKGKFAGNHGFPH